MFYFFLFIFGLAAGSFLNVLIDRLPKGQSISGRSHCDSCRHKLSWSDLIPIVSFFLLKGKCRYCGKKISWQYPVVELITGAVFLLVFNFQFSIFNENFKFQILNYIQLFACLGITSCLIVIFFSDLKYQIIPDSMQIILFLFVLLYRITVPHFTPARCNLGCYIALILNYCIAGLIVMLPILFLFLVTRGRGMGFGDVKLAFTIGFLLGIKSGLLALYFGFVIGGTVGLILLLAKKKKLKSKIAFGPFLVLGILIMLFWQKEILEIFERIYRF